MSVSSVSPVGYGSQFPFTPPATNAASAASAGVAVAAETSRVSAQSVSITSVSSQAQSYFGSAGQSGPTGDLLRLVIVLMLLDQILNGEQGGQGRMAALGLALGLSGGSQSSFSYFSALESYSFTQQTSAASSLAVRAGSAIEAYTGFASVGDSSVTSDGAGRSLDAVA